ncbi:hypothetical protein EYF80_002960 [Liparis tanakae]|uniref:Uncharacterized protein n=1 Tax=Liparis tanakae TaxID=230148 RepID=A0A4Z2J9Q3_9TELE|nr:hypothetical protein EYF80_002960 [Liparis tanakae]
MHPSLGVWGEEIVSGYWQSRLRGGRLTCQRSNQCQAGEQRLDSQTQQPRELLEISIKPLGRRKGLSGETLSIAGPIAGLFHSGILPDDNHYIPANLQSFWICTFGEKEDVHEPRLLLEEKGQITPSWLLDVLSYRVCTFPSAVAPTLPNTNVLPSNATVHCSDPSMLTETLWQYYHTCGLLFFSVVPICGCLPHAGGVLFHCDGCPGMQEMVASPCSS